MTAMRILNVSNLSLMTDERLVHVGMLHGGEMVAKISWRHYSLITGKSSGSQTTNEKGLTWPIE